MLVASPGGGPRQVELTQRGSLDVLMLMAAPGSEVWAFGAMGTILRSR